MSNYAESQIIAAANRLLIAHNLPPCEQIAPAPDEWMTDPIRGERSLALAQSILDGSTRPW